MQDKRIALVTGANQGIGLQIAKELVAKTLTVLVGSRNLERGMAAAKEVGPEAHALQLDAMDQASIVAAAERVRNEFGRLDVLIQNAAISNTNKRRGRSVEEYAATTRPSNVSLDEMRAVWEPRLHQDESQRICGHEDCRRGRPRSGACCAAWPGRPDGEVHALGKRNDPVVMWGENSMSSAIPKTELGGKRSARYRARHHDTRQSRLRADYGLVASYSTTADRCPLAPTLITAACTNSE
jgi:hypothetical protein